MEAWQWIAIGWLAFAVSHSGLLLSAVKTTLTNRLGRRNFLLVYSTISFATFVPMVWVYSANLHSGGMVWFQRDNPGMVAFSMVFSSVGIALATAGILKPSPLSLYAGKSPTVTGLPQITRHPMLAGFAMWAIGHVILNGFMADIVFFSGFVLYGIIAAEHQDRRLLAAKPELQPMFDQTAFVPFAAILGRKTKLVWSALPVWQLGLGLLVSAGIFWLH